MTNKTLPLFFFFSIILLAGCGTSTRIVNSWRDPAVVIDTANVHRFVVAALLKNQSVRRMVEDDMASLYPGKAVQSYKELGTGELKENDEVYNQKLKSEGYDGIVMMSLIDVDRSDRYVPGVYPAYFGTWRGYWGYSWGVYGTGTYATDKTYHVEVNVYSLRTDKLIWTASTSTVNPSGKNELFKEVSRAVCSRMKKEGFLQ